MLSDILIPTDYFLSSRQLYCLITDAKGKVLLVNPLAETHLHIRQGHIIAIQLTEPAAGPLKTITYTHIINHKPVTIRWEVVLMNASDHKSKRYKWIAPHRQCTEHPANNLLSFNEELLNYKNIADTAPVSIWMTDAEKNLIYVNQSWRCFTGEQVSVVAENGWQYLIYKEDIEEVKKVFHDSFKRRAPATLTYRMRQKNGVYGWVQNICMPRFDSNHIFQGYIGTITDVQELKAKEQQVQKSEKFYYSLFANSLDGILLTEADGTITYSSTSVQDILGYEEDDLLGKNAFEFVHPDDMNLAVEAFQREVKERAQVKFIIIRLRKKNDGWLWCMVRGHNLLSNSYINKVVIYLHDDTQRKQANDALRESEKRFRTLIRDLQLGVVLLNAEGHIVIYNKAIAQMLGIEEEKLVGCKMTQIVLHAVHENGSPYTIDEMPLPRIRKTKQPVNNLVMGVDNANSKERSWLLVNAEPVLDEQGNIIHIIFSVNDITERKKLEQKLIREKVNQQKLLTQATIDGQEKERKEIGKELHDNIGQQLTTTKLFLDLAKTTADDTTNEMISLALKGISDVINETRRMSRALVPPTLGDLGLIDSINDLVDSISRAQYIKIEFDYFECNEDFISDNKKLMLFRIIQEQLNNIVKHAEAHHVTVTLSDKETHLLLEVKDDGKGFELSKVRRGLGLTNIKNRAELFGGREEIISAPGQGCTLRVYTPYGKEEAD